MSREEQNIDARASASTLLWRDDMDWSHTMSDTIPHYVYEWVDPRDMSIFYVGITIDLYERYRQHMRCDGINPQKDQRIQEILMSGHLPIMRTIEQVTTFDHAAARERYWIQRYLREGVKLLNIAGTSRPNQPKREKRIKKPSEPPDQYVIEPWESAGLFVAKRGSRLITVEYATDAEFQSWVEWNGLHPNKSFPEWKFDHRFYVINHALSHGRQLQFVDGMTLAPVNKPPDGAA